MPKTPIYFMPGLGAGPEIFEKLELSSKIYDLFYLKWKEPMALEETLANYAMRMAEDIKHHNPVLIGVSFGGVLMQEISKHIDTKQVIIISSIKSNQELPLKFKIANVSRLYKLFPTKIVSNFENYAIFFIGKPLKKRAELYKKYLSVRGEKYLKWSIHHILHWQQKKPLQNIIHIHGTKDPVFPIKNINNAIEINGGTHVMVLTRAKLISKIIHDNLSC